MTQTRIIHTADRRRRRRAAMTLPELLIALSITALVALCTATMMMAVSYGTESRTEMRNLSVRLKLATHRIDTALRTSKMVLQSGDDYIVLWIADTRADDVPNLSEIRLIERDPDTGVLRGYAADFDSMTESQIEAADTQYALGDNFRTITTALKTGPYFPPTIWAKDVTAWTITPVAVVAQSASLVDYQLTVTVSGLSDTAVESVALRNH